MRSLLTMLGILIGTAAVILLVAVGTGISNAVQTTIESMGSNAVYRLAGAERRWQRQGRYDQPPGQADRRRHQGAV